MTDSIAAVRLVRNLRYKVTYVRIFERFLESTEDPDVVELLQALIQSQQAGIALLAGYLRRLDASLQELELNDKLLEQAQGRSDLKSQVRFIYDGLDRAVGWYRMQLADKQMTADPQLRRLLVDLGEMEASKLWRTEALMGMLKIPTRAKEREPEPDLTGEQPREEAWRPRLMDDLSQAGRGSEKPAWATRSQRRKRDR